MVLCRSLGILPLQENSLITGLRMVCLTLMYVMLSPLSLGCLLRTLVYSGISLRSPMRDSSIDSKVTNIKLCWFPLVSLWHRHLLLLSSSSLLRTPSLKVHRVCSWANSSSMLITNPLDLKDSLLRRPYIEMGSLLRTSIRCSTSLGKALQLVRKVRSLLLTCNIL